MNTERWIAPGSSCVPTEAFGMSGCRCRYRSRQSCICRALSSRASRCRTSGAGARRRPAVARARSSLAAVLPAPAKATSNTKSWAAARAGVTHFKLTGGEPTARKDLPVLVEMLRRIEGVEDLSLTTNGILLEPQLPKLKAAGLNRITVSVDSLREERFAEVTRGGLHAVAVRPYRHGTRTPCALPRAVGSAHAHPGRPDRR